MCGSQKGKLLRHGLYLIVGKPRDRQYLFPNQLLVVRIVASEVEKRGVVRITHQAAQGADLQELAAAFAMLHDAADPKLMAQYRNHLANVMAAIGTREIIVHNYVVRSLKGSPGNEDKR